MIGVLFATLQEADPFLQHLCAQPASREGIPVYTGCLPASGHKPICIGITGMGPSAAATATECFLRRHKPKTLINAGICGALENGDGFDPGAIFAVNEAALDPSAPGAFDTPFRLSTGPWSDLPTARLVTVNAPVFEHDRKAVLAVQGELVDMEGAAVAHNAVRAGVTCWIVKGVTDGADNGGRNILQQNLGWVSRRIARVLVNGLAAIERNAAGCQPIDALEHHS